MVTRMSYRPAVRLALKAWNTMLSSAHRKYKQAEDQAKSRLNATTGGTSRGREMERSIKPYQVSTRKYFRAFAFYSTRMLAPV